MCLIHHARHQYLTMDANDNYFVQCKAIHSAQGLLDNDLDYDSKEEKKISVYDDSDGIQSCDVDEHVWNLLEIDGEKYQLEH